MMKILALPTQNHGNHAQKKPINHLGNCCFTLVTIIAIMKWCEITTNE